MIDLPYYLKVIEAELAQKLDTKYIGSVDFIINMFGGGISNMTVAQKRSVKKPNPDKEEKYGETKKEKS